MEHQTLGRRFICPVGPATEREFILDWWISRFMPSLGVRSPCSRSKIQFRVQYEFLFWEPLTSFGDNFEAEMACLWPYLFRHSCHSSSPKASLRTLLERQGNIRKTGVSPESLSCQRLIRMGVPPILFLYTFSIPSSSRHEKCWLLVKLF